MEICETTKQKFLQFRKTTRNFVQFRISRNYKKNTKLSTLETKIRRENGWMGGQKTADSDMTRLQSRRNRGSWGKKRLERMMEKKLVTRRWWAQRKSAPIIGRETATRRKGKFKESVPVSTRKSRPEMVLRRRVRSLSVNIATSCCLQHWCYPATIE